MLAFSLGLLSPRVVDEEGETFVSQPQTPTPRNEAGGWPWEPASVTIKRREAQERLRERDKKDKP